MDLEKTLREMRQEVERLGNEESARRTRIAQLKQLLEERQKKLDNLEKLKQEEAKLLASLSS